MCENQRFSSAIYSIAARRFFSEILSRRLWWFMAVCCSLQLEWPTAQCAAGDREADWMAIGRWRLRPGNESIYRPLHPNPPYTGLSPSPATSRLAPIPKPFSMCFAPEKGGPISLPVFDLLCRAEPAQATGRPQRRRLLRSTICSGRRRMGWSDVKHAAARR